MRTVGIVIAALVVGTIGFGACGAVLYMLGVEDIGIEGDTYTIRMVNDTAEPLEFADCVDGATCESVRLVRWVDPGESSTGQGTVGIVSRYRVRDEAGAVVGCFKLDFDERPKIDLYASELEPCP